MFDPSTTASASSHDLGAPAVRASRLRSRVTNGTKLVAGVDGRSADARRYRDVAMALADDLGGASSLSEAQRALVSQAAALTVQSERMQGAMLRGEPLDVEQQTRVANVLARTLSRLGIKRRVQEPPRLVDVLKAGR